MSTSGKICSRQVSCITADSPILAAAQLMRHNHVGALVVVERADGKRRPIGLITDRDIVVEVNAADLNQNALTVGDIMSRDVAAVRENEEVLGTIEIMRHKGVRRLPVIDDAGYLVG